MARGWLEIGEEEGEGGQEVEASERGEKVSWQPRVSSYFTLPLLLISSFSSILDRDNREKAAEAAL